MRVTDLFNKIELYECNIPAWKNSEIKTEFNTIRFYFHIYKTHENQKLSGFKIESLDDENLTIGTIRNSEGEYCTGAEINNFCWLSDLKYAEIDDSVLEKYSSGEICAAVLRTMFDVPEEDPEWYKECVGRTKSWVVR